MRNLIPHLLDKKMYQQNASLSSIIASERKQILLLNVTSLPTHVAQNSRSRKEHSYVLVLSKARKLEGPTPYHYISIEVERARFHVPRRFSSKSWKIQSASRSKRYANEHPGHERDATRAWLRLFPLFFYPFR